MKSLKHLFLILFFILSCDSNEEDDKINSVEIKINSYELLENTINGVETKTYLDFIGEGEFKMQEHGIVWYKKIGDKKQINKGELLKNEYNTKISSGLLKDSVYKTYPFIKFNEKLIYGDTLEFISFATSTVIIDKLIPKDGFIYDTIQVIGKNFCLEDFNNKIIFNNRSFLEIISESDTLIKAIIPSYINNSELAFILNSCNTSTPIKDIFTINEPVLDSINSKEKYVNDILTLFGENIHSSISEVWLDDIKSQVINSNSVDSLSIRIPKNLAVGKVSLKLKVLDRIIEKPNYFQTTTPYIDNTLPNKIGFLDTLTVEGNYFIQNDSKIKAYVGNSQQKIVSVNKTEIKIFIDRYFNDTNPKIKLEFTDFEVEKEIEMLPPFIHSFNKENYHLSEIDFIVKTDNFLNDDIEIGGRKKKFGVDSNVNLNGDLNLSLKKWLNIDSYTWNYNLTAPGLLEVKIKTQFGEDSKQVKIFAPIITSVNSNAFLPSDYIEIFGEDFAFSRFTKIYIDDDEIPNPNNSSYNINNNIIYFELLKNTNAGLHKLYVVTAGQKSNTIEYTIKETKIFSVNKNTGTRRDIYEVTGENLDKLVIKANDNYCEIINKGSSKVTFRLPYSIQLTSAIKLTANSGDQEFDLGTFNGIESFEIVENSFLDQTNYYERHVSFSDENSWYYVNNKGVFKFSVESKKWENIDTNTPPFNTPIFGEKAYVTFKDGIARYPLYDKIYSYNVNNKTWSQTEIKNIVVKNGVIVEDVLFAIQNSTNDFYKVNLLDDSIQKIEKPSDLKILYENITYGDGKIFINPFQGSAYYYDIKNNNWKNIGRPRNFSGTYNNIALKYYHGSLFFSGGWTDAGVEHRLYEYQLNSNTWIEQTPMLKKVYNHSLFLNNDEIYIGLGIGRHNYENYSTQIYNINKDPH